MTKFTTACALVASLVTAGVYAGDNRLPPSGDVGALLAQPPASGVILVGEESPRGAPSKLMFQLLPSGKARMAYGDGDGPLSGPGTAYGTYEVKGNHIQLRFFNGACVYDGTIQGDKVAGRGTVGRDSWKWSVRLRQPARPQAPQVPAIRPAAPDTTAERREQLLRERDALQGVSIVLAQQQVDKCLEDAKRCERDAAAPEIGLVVSGALRQQAEDFRRQAEEFRADIRKYRQRIADIDAELRRLGR